MLIIPTGNGIKCATQNHSVVVAFTSLQRDLRTACDMSTPEAFEPHQSLDVHQPHGQTHHQSGERPRSRFGSRPVRVDHYGECINLGHYSRRTEHNPLSTNSVLG